MEVRIDAEGPVRLGPRVALEVGPQVIAVGIVVRIDGDGATWAEMPELWPVPQGRR